MLQAKNYKIMLGAAAVNTFGLIILMVLNDTNDNMSTGFSIVALLGFLVAAITLWGLGTKSYIDSAIEEKINQKRESAS